jgi:GAF domain-containing protein
MPGMDSRDPRLVILSELASAIASTTEPAAIYTAIAEVAVRRLGATVARVWVNDPAAGALRAAGSFGVHRDIEAALLDAVTVPHGAGIPGRVAVARAPEFIVDAHDDPRWLNARFIRALGLHAYAGLPLIAGGTVTGVLSILFERPRMFTENDRALAAWLADSVAITVRVAQLYEERRRADLQSAVMSLANSVAHELNSPLTVVIGHLALLDGQGDPEVLRRVEGAQAAAGRLAEVVRRLQRITHLEMFRQTAPDLPPMLDIWRSSRD